MQESIKALAGISMTTEIVLFSLYPHYWEQSLSYSRHPKICMGRMNISEFASRPMGERDQEELCVKKMQWFSL